MAGGNLPSIIRWTLTKLSSLAGGPSSSSSSSSPLAAAQGEIHQLRSIMANIQAALDDAEDRDVRENIERLHLNELQEVAYDAEDVVDEYEYEVLRARLESKNVKGDDDDDPVEAGGGPSEVPVPHDLSSRVREIAARFREIDAEWERLRFPESTGKRRRRRLWKPSETTAFSASESRVLGREDEERKLIELLLFLSEKKTNDGDSADRSPVSVLPVVGMGGVGKTTLAQLAFNDPKVCHFFDLRAWVCVSGDEDAVSLSRKVMLSLFGESIDAMEPDQLHLALKEESKGKRVLVVLDDVWSDKWESLMDSLRSAEVAKIIITTRNESILKGVPSPAIDGTVHLNGLSFDSSWSLFKEIAFRGLERDLNLHSDLVEVGRKILVKCNGLPLAIKVLGGMLRYESDPESWVEILESDMWELDDEHDEILPALKLSYDRMPTHLKWCFAHLSLFPKDCVVKKEKIVSLWMSQGLSQPKGKKMEEHFADECLENMLQRSILQHHSAEREEYTMHDLIRDLTQSVAGDEWSRVGIEDFFVVPKKVRHASLLVGENTKTEDIRPLPEPKPVRTLLTVAPGNVSHQLRLDVRILDSWFVNLRRLRALDLSNTEVEELPESIGDLKQLRYLCLAYTKVKRLPASVTKLYNLQTFDGWTKTIQELPVGIGNLINLRHLKLNNAWVCIPSGFGGLSNLQNLRVFNVVAGNWHCQLRELQHLVSLKGTLDIYGLGNLVYADVCLREFYLRSLDGVETLSLNWENGVGQSSCHHGEASASSHGHEDELDGQLPSAPKNVEGLAAEEDVLVVESVPTPMKSEDTAGEESSGHHHGKEAAEPSLREEALAELVLERLRPHTNLSKLRVWNYNGVGFPRWLGDASFANMTSVGLCKCMNCTILPPLGQLPSLRDLTLFALPVVPSVGREFCALDPAAKGFPSLEVLSFFHMFEWAEWCVAEEGDDFPRLGKLQIRGCPKLIELPNRVCSSLTKLEVSDPHLLASPHLSKLQSLTVVSSSVTSLLLEHQVLSSLRELTIWSCHKLASVEGLTDLTSLEALTVDNCGRLSALPPALPSLTSMTLRGSFNSELICSILFPSLLSLEVCWSECSSLMLDCLCLPSLKKLGVQSCSKLETVAGLGDLVSLQALEIAECPELQFAPGVTLPAKLRDVRISKSPTAEKWYQNQVLRFF